MEVYEQTLTMQSFTSSSRAHSSSPVKPSERLIDALKQKASQLGDIAIQLLTPQPNMQVRKRCIKGLTTLVVYDRMTERRLQFTCEEDLRIWIDNRYNTYYPGIEIGVMAMPHRQSLGDENSD